MIHAITATWAFNEANKRQSLSRRCSECGNEQIAAERRKTAAADRKNCGTLISPEAGGENQHTQKNETK